jgi:predicted HTH transcriptional regulator
LSSPEKVLHSLIAFANTAGGLLVIGVENGTKRVRGLLHQESWANPSV